MRNSSGYICCFIFRPDMRRAGFNEAQDCETPTDFQNFHANMHSEGTANIMLRIRSE